MSMAARAVSSRAVSSISLAGIARAMSQVTLAAEPTRVKRVRRRAPGHGRTASNCRGETIADVGLVPVLAVSPRGALGVENPADAAGSVALRCERDLVVDRVEDVFRLLLGGLDVPIPDRTAHIRLGGGVGQRLADRQARCWPERATCVDERAARRDVGADLRQIDGDASDRSGSTDLVAAEGRITDIDVEGSRKH